MQLHSIHFENLFFVLIHIHFTDFLYWSVYILITNTCCKTTKVLVCWVLYRDIVEARFDWLLCINSLLRVAFLRCRDRDLAVQGCQYNTIRCSGYQVLRLWIVVFCVLQHHLHTNALFDISCCAVDEAQCGTTTSLIYCTDEPIADSSSWWLRAAAAK